MCPVSTVCVESIRRVSEWVFCIQRINSRRTRAFVVTCATFWAAGKMAHGTVCVYICVFFTCQSEGDVPALCGLWVVSECVKEIQCDYLSNKKWRGVSGLSWGWFLRVYIQLWYIFTCSLVSSIRRWVSDGATLQFNVSNVFFSFLCPSLFPAV